MTKSEPKPAKERIADGFVHRAEDLMALGHSRESVRKALKEARRRIKSPDPTTASDPESAKPDEATVSVKRSSSP